MSQIRKRQKERITDNIMDKVFKMCVKFLKALGRSIRITDEQILVIWLWELGAFLLWVSVMLPVVSIGRGYKIGVIVLLTVYALTYAYGIIKIFHRYMSYKLILVIILLWPGFLLLLLSVAILVMCIARGNVVIFILALILAFLTWAYGIIRIFHHYMHPAFDLCVADLRSIAARWNWSYGGFISTLFVVLFLLVNLLRILSKHI